jgi:phage gp36-like protein
MFITREDLDNSLYEEIINAVVQKCAGNEEKAGARITYGIRTALSIVESHLCSLWDTSKIFDKTGDDRSPMLVDICCDIALYVIADVLEDMPATVSKSYEDAIALLEKIMSGKMSIPGAVRPLNPDTGVPDTYIKHGGISRVY